MRSSYFRLCRVKKLQPAAELELTFMKLFCFKCVDDFCMMDKRPFTCVQLFKPITKYSQIKFEEKSDYILVAKQKNVFFFTFSRTHYFLRDGTDITCNKSLWYTCVPLHTPIFSRTRYLLLFSNEKNIKKKT